MIAPGDYGNFLANEKTTYLSMTTGTYRDDDNLLLLLMKDDLPVNDHGIPLDDDDTYYGY